MKATIEPGVCPGAGTRTIEPSPHVVAGREAEVGRPLEGVALEPQAGEALESPRLGVVARGVALLRRVDPDRYPEVGQSADVVPMRVGDHHALQRGEVVAAGGELCAGGLSQVVRRPLVRGQEPNVRVYPGAE